MSEPILKISQLTARVEEKEILHDINFEMRKGETHVLMGPNGAGKSTLGYVLMGNPKYEVTGGSISFKGKDITAESADKRAKDGMFLSFQEPLEVPGLSVSNFIEMPFSRKKAAMSVSGISKKELKKNLEFLDLDDSYAERSLNVGFSGGEKKKIETLQLMMLRPSLAILDETDSGLDVDAVRLVSKGVEEYQKDRDGALLIITHSTRILESLHVDYTHVMVNGHIVATGDGSMVEEINEKGYERFLNSVPGGDD